VLCGSRKHLDRSVLKVFDERFSKHFIPLMAKIEDTTAVYACLSRDLCANFLPSFRKNFLSTYVAVLFLKSRVRNFDADAACSRYVRYAKIYCRNSILDRVNVPRMFGEVTHQRQTVNFGVVAYVDGKIFVDTKVFDWFGNGTRLSQTAQFPK